MAGERYVVKLPCVRLIIVGDMLSVVFTVIHGHVYTVILRVNVGEAAVCTPNCCWWHAL